MSYGSCDECTARGEQAAAVGVFAVAMANGRAVSLALCDDCASTAGPCGYCGDGGYLPRPEPTPCPHCAAGAT